ncbi:MAG: 1-(5-phosphoribosyl)-5-[(5-phosphoribosylamino)methylideneamino]imidazole-4-carboxamide isomerase [Acidobacteria bacterium]|jgi:phosphoribosylformimino-5-aminoimidazole carboxamide ribotide isomerase|nr:MAG: 1-(5-phosphoribosyl)-5-[(5-phosphoribosylamino)methylideneamino]imidazole-4-carboxamide isomerase [Acidobacteriota bacterium]
MKLKDFIIPAIDIKDGKVVRLLKGDFRKDKVYSESPRDMAELFQELGFKRLHVVDLDGSLEGVPVNLQSIKTIRSVFSGKVQVGGGIRGLKTCRVLYDEGIDLLVVGTVAVKDPELFEQMAQSFPHRIILALDSRGGKVATSGWTQESSLRPEEVAKRYDSLPIWGYLYTNVDRDGTLEGVDVEIYRDVKRFVSKPLIASGGVSDIEDVKKLIGVVEGVVVGKAIYEGRINIREL